MICKRNVQAYCNYKLVVFLGRRCTSLRASNSSFTTRQRTQNKLPVVARIKHGLRHVRKLQNTQAVRVFYNVVVFITGVCTSRRDLYNTANASRRQGAKASSAKTKRQGTEAPKWQRDGAQTRKGAKGDETPIRQRDKASRQQNAKATRRQDDKATKRQCDNAPSIETNRHGTNTTRRATTRQGDSTEATRRQGDEATR